MKTKDEFPLVKRQALLILAIGSVALLSGCATTSSSTAGPPPPDPTVPLYDRDDLIKEPDPPKIPTKPDTPSGESHLKKTGPDQPLYERPKSE